MLVMENYPESAREIDFLHNSRYKHQTNAAQEFS